MTPLPENTTPQIPRTTSGAKSRPYIYPPICECGVKKDRRSERCRDCQYIFDKRPRRDEDPNVYIIDGEHCRKIPLTQDQWATVSEIDYADLIEHNWLAWWSADTESYYAKRAVKSGGRSRIVMMHQAVYIAAFGSIPEGKQPDHKNTITLDNRRCNLRAADNSENRWNSGKRRNNTSGYKGVTWSKQKRKWMAQICVYGRQQCLGLFDTKEDAHAAYCEAAKRLHGEFARLI